jgi:DNA-binding IclR family transcriptional regulator
VLARNLPARTQTTITDAARLRADLDATRTRGYATNHRELTDEISAVAAAIRDSGGRPVASMSISVPAQRMSDELWDRYGRLAAAAAQKVSATLGHEAVTASAASAR